VLVFAVAIPQNGFLGTGAPFAADVNLLVQVAMALALMAGAILARRELYRAHGVMQTSVLLLNLVMIATVMWPSTRGQVMAAFPAVFEKWYFAAPSIHAMLGILVEVLGLYVALVAGTKLVPNTLRFHNRMRWMQTELVLWWITLLSGIATYYVWYVHG
jgi:uncharacterized membrane protein YozB (DUF420 family)